MTSWNDVAAAAPDLAEAVHARFAANTHHVMATLRADGSPRVSGTEVAFHAGEMALGSMSEARKALDLRRDPRVAIHSNPSDPKMGGGDAKVAGRAVEVADDAEKAAFLQDSFPDDARPPEPFHLFRIDLSEVVLTEVDEENGELITTAWHPGRGVEVRRRR